MYLFVEQVAIIMVLFVQSKSLLVPLGACEKVASDLGWAGGFPQDTSNFHYHLQPASHNLVSILHIKIYHEQNSESKFQFLIQSFFCLKKSKVTW